MARRYDSAAMDTYYGGYKFRSRLEASRVFATPDLMVQIGQLAAEVRAAGHTYEKSRG